MFDQPFARAVHLLGATAITAVMCASAAQAQTARQADYALPAQELARSLREVSLRSGVSVVVPGELVSGKQAPPLSGHYDARQAIELLLQGSGLRASLVGDALVVSRAAAIVPGGTATAPQSGDAGNIVVTGSRIRGAPIASPVIRLTQEQIRTKGQATLAEAVRAIPQNFGGGQNPGIGNNVPATSAVNVGSATSVNLRGLGSDATLTLVNGHRLSYSASRQAVDISSIPLGAVDRMEIVPDGASALYGSDAVAGVVNVILRRDYSGVQTGARIGGSTDGGDFEQRYSLVTGARWSSGGFIAAYEFGRTTAILGGDRSYAAAQAPALTLFPFIRSHSAVVSGHQDLGQSWSLEFDGFFNQRFSSSSYASNAAGDIKAGGAALAFNSRSFVVAPTVNFRPGGDWKLFATGSIAQDRTRYDVKSFFRGTVFDFPGNCYCNRGASFEIGGDGTLVEGPGGPIKLASGAGWRTNRLVRFNGVGASTNVTKTQDSYYAYGEISLPLVSTDQHVRLIDRLSASAAARYERYPGIGEVVTPKVGAIYAPSPDFMLKASWGKSFRAPTLYQQYQSLNVVLARVSAFGGSGFPAGSTGLLAQGGNPDLKPERATSWSTTLAIDPRALDGLRLEASYFDTRYRDRVVTPIIFLSQALSDPVNAGQLAFNPSAALIAETIASANSFANVSGAPFDPANVRVFVDDRNVNAGLQKIHGFDLQFGYSRTLGAGLGDLNAQLNATFLKSSQQLTPAQPVIPLAGILFNPPHFFARGDLAWSKGPFTLDAGLTHIGGVRDTRATPVVKVRGMTTFDLTARIRSLAATGFLSGLDASATIQNLFNEKPARIAATLPSDAPYDSTNYSPVGRFVAVTLTRKW